MKLGEKIKSYRSTKKLTLKDIASHLGVSEATAQRYESGKITTIDYEKIISKLFDCSPSELMGWDKNNDTSLVLANDEKLFLEKFRKLSHDDQMLLFGIMDSFIDARKSANLPATGTK